ncbi:MAG: prepilin-type N-terminal cleavage/methylation domain-containing protein [Candidatus Paracaedibacteraceae bacterium]|nr:prepilin-type N-terminal cleavage/methylation domain-containing protein [Candidatus Paracaedibacteraceae bacterium]
MKILNRKLKAFSLIEISIVLIVIGLITTAIFKGQDLIESARLQATLQEMNQLKLSVIHYRDQFGQWPGNDVRAQQRFGTGVSNGSGRGLIMGSESAQAWIHLKAAGLIENPLSEAKIGGHYIIAGNPSGLQGNYIVLSGHSDEITGMLTPQQAMRLKGKAGEMHPGEGQLIIQSASGQNTTACLTGQTYNLKSNHPSCIVLMKI